MSAHRLDLESAAIASLSRLATHDVKAAADLLDETGVQAQDFNGPHASTVWPVVEFMVRDGRQPDFFAIQAKCPKVPREYLTSVLMGDGTAPAKERLAAVRDAGQRRRITSALRAVNDVVKDSTRSLSDAVGEAQKVLESIQGTATRGITLESDVMALVDVLEAIAAGTRESTLLTGIEALDAAVGGLQPTLTVIGALPGVGKSGLLAGIIRNLAQRKVRVGVFSLEDERSWIVKRLVAEAAKVPLFVLQNKPLARSQLERVGEAIETLHATMRHVVVDDRPAMNAAEIVSSAREMLTKHSVKALLVDHLGEIRLSRSERHDLDIADVLQQLRALAKMYRVPVVVACHLRRRDGLGIKDEPKLTDFAFSAAVERMARVGLALSKPDEHTLKVHVLKQTNGISGISVDLKFHGPSGVVVNEAAPGVIQAIAKMYGDGNGE